MSGFFWRLESHLGRSFKWNKLNHSVPLPVGWRGQDGTRLQGKLRHIFGVFSYRWPYVSVLLVEELSICGTTLCAVRGCLVRRSGRQAVLPVFRIVKGDLQLLPDDFTWCQSTMFQQARWVCGGVALVGGQAAMPEVGWSRQRTWRAYLALDGGTWLADRAATWICRLSYRFDSVEEVGWWAMMTTNARWRGLGQGEGVVGQAGLDCQWDMGT